MFFHFVITRGEVHKVYLYYRTGWSNLIGDLVHTLLSITGSPTSKDGRMSL